MSRASPIATGEGTVRWKSKSSSPSHWLRNGVLPLTLLGRGAFIAALPLLTALPARAADITGAWKIDGSVFFNSVDTTCHFKKAGEAVVGTCENDQGLGEFTPVAINGAKVGWSWNPGPALLTFDATLTSDTTMKGKITVRGFTGSFTAAKQ